MSLDSCFGNASINCFNPQMWDLRSLLAFEDQYLTGCANGYFLGAEPPSQLWQEGVEGLNYVPSYSDDIVLLGGGEKVAAFRISTREMLWSDDSVGLTAGRHPFLNRRIAIYHGNLGLRAVEPSSGDSIWQFAVSTAQAAVSQAGDSVFVVDHEGGLNALSLGDGSLRWRAGDVAGDGSSLIATEGSIFVSQNDEGTGQAHLRTLRASTGEMVWETSLPGAFFADNPGLILADGVLLAFLGNVEGQSVQLDGVTQAYDPADGQLLWQTDETSLSGSPAASPAGADEPFAPQFAAAGNGVVYYFVPSLNRIQARSVHGGRLLWSDRHSGVRALSLANQSLLVLADPFIAVPLGYIAVYRRDHWLYFPHAAAGHGQSTLFALANSGTENAAILVECRDDDGNSIPTGLLNGLEEISPYMEQVLPAGGSLLLEMAAASSALPMGGWCVVQSDQGIEGGAVLRFQEEATGQVFEAGVGSAQLTSRVTFPVQMGGSVNTAIAIASPLDSTQVRIRLLDRDGGEEISRISLSFVVHWHRALFVEQLFPEIGDFTGTVEITADVPIILTALRTWNGLQLSSLPADFGP